MLTFTNLAIRRGPRLLFSQASFSIYRGEKAGVIGENGSGKSSLLALVRGELQPDAGTFDRPGNLAIAHVAQELAATDRAAIDFVMDGDAELRQTERAIEAAEQKGDGTRLAELHARYAAIGGYDARSRAGRLLHGLGFSAREETQAVSSFSGGWRVRLNVAQALMCRSDVLLLDEPTNHLDLDAVLWLESWLKEYRGTLMLIAHDREFLDRITDRIVNIEHGEVRAYRGNYSAFEEQRASELAQQQALYTRQQREIKHMESFVERFRAKATKARQAQSRLKALERMQRIAPAHVDFIFEFSFLQPEKLPQPLLTIEEQAIGYGGSVLLSNVNFSVAPGDRVALLGRNGAGKSTLMKMLAGELAASAGKRTEARDLRIGYFAQHQLEQLDVAQSPLENLKRFGGAPAARATELELRNYLAGFGFRGDRVFEPVGPFSGGEKARLVLALLAYVRPNLMLLDEPTNHLDLEMRQALAVALQDYEGAVILVSHDRHLLRTVADDLYIVGNGRVSPFDGDLDDYARWLADSSAPENEVEQSSPSGASAAARRDRKRDEAERRNRLSPFKAELARLERELERLSQEKAELDRSLSSPAIYAADAKDKLKELLQAQTRNTQTLQAIEAAWLEASERLEEAMRS